MKKVIFIIGIALCYFASFSQETGTFNDSRDGKVYKTVKIGTQTWMAENLNYETDSSCCYYFDKSNCDKCGRLYTFYAAKMACPKGWHLPSESEWIKLRDYLGGNKATDKLRGQTFGLGLIKSKESNSSGFTALPCGLATDFQHLFAIVESDGQRTKKSIIPPFRDINFAAFYWSGDIKGKKARAFRIISSAVKTYSSMTNKELHFGLSVRCIKD